MNTIRFILFTIIPLVVILLLNSLFIVKETEKALLLRFGEIVRTDFQPGLHFKIPFINNVLKFDARLQTLDSPPETWLTNEKKKVKVDSFAKWRIDNIKKFYTSVGGNNAEANFRLAENINNGLRAEFAKRTVKEVVSGERSEVVNIVTQAVNKQAMEKYGITVVDVRVKRVDLPNEVNDSVYQRMESERQRIAKELRSQGQEQAERIRAEADRRRTVIISDAYRESEKIRGNGDASASEIYAKAYGVDKAFYRFYRSLSAYQSSFNNKEDIILLDTKARFFEFFDNQ